MIEKVRRPYCMKVLPTVYEDSLSYMESVNKLVNKINEVIDAFDEFGDEILNEAKAYTDSAIAEGLADVNEKIDEINELIDEINANYDSFINYINGEFDDFIEDVNGQIELINNALELMENKLEGELANQYNQLVLMIQQNNDYLLSEMGKFLNQIKVINYFTGEETTIQGMFDYLARLHLTDSITYTVMAQRSKTYTQLANMNMTYTNLVLHGNTLYV